MSFTATVQPTVATAAYKHKETVSSSHLEHRPNDEADEHKKLTEEYFATLGDKNVTPLWTAMDKMVPPFPNPKAVPTHWKYEKIHPALLRAADLVAAEDAERRVLVLVDDVLPPPCTTDTIYGGLQIVMPGETAPAHRHRAFALRFIIEGSGGFTAVEGEKIVMHRGDVVLTPSWQWHDHGNEGTGPVIWLDGLDLPVWQQFPINFVEQYIAPRYPSAPAPESAARIPWKGVQENLDNQRVQHAIYQYRLAGGSHLSKTISAQAERVEAGHTTSVSKEVLSYIYHVYDGKGYSLIKTPREKEPKKIEWVGRDTFSVPSYSEVTHTSTMGSGSAYLFAINDRPLVENLSFVEMT